MPATRTRGQRRTAPRDIDVARDAHMDRACAQLLLELGHRPRPLRDAPHPQLGAQRPALPHLGRAPLPLELERRRVAVLDLGLLAVAGAAAEPLLLFFD